MREKRSCVRHVSFSFFYFIPNVLPLLVELLIGMQLQEGARTGLAGLTEKEGLEFSETRAVLGRKGGRLVSYHSLTDALQNEMKEAYVLVEKEKREQGDGGVWSRTTTLLETDHSRTRLSSTTFEISLYVGN